MAEQNGPQVQTVNYRLEFHPNPYGWQLVMIDENGNAGVAAFGPAESAPILLNLMQAGGAVRHDSPNTTLEPDRSSQQLYLPDRW